jgi:hypothetical protein
MAAPTRMTTTDAHALFMGKLNEAASALGMCKSFADQKDWARDFAARCTPYVTAVADSLPADAPPPTSLFAKISAMIASAPATFASKTISVSDVYSADQEAVLASASTNGFLVFYSGKYHALPLSAPPPSKDLHLFKILAVDYATRQRVKGYIVQQVTHQDFMDSALSQHKLPEDDAPPTVPATLEPTSSTTKTLDEARLAALDAEKEARRLKSEYDAAVAASIQTAAEEEARRKWYEARVADENRAAAVRVAGVRAAFPAHRPVVAAAAGAGADPDVEYLYTMLAEKTAPATVYTASVDSVRGIPFGMDALCVGSILVVAKSNASKYPGSDGCPLYFYRGTATFMLKERALTGKQYKIISTDGTSMKLVSA